SARTTQTVRSEAVHLGSALGGAACSPHGGHGRLLSNLAMHWSTLLSRDASVSGRAVLHWRRGASASSLRSTDQKILNSISTVAKTKFHGPAPPPRQTGPLARPPALAAGQA